MDTEDDIIEDYLSGEIIDPCEYDAYSLAKFAEFFGDEGDSTF